MKRTHINFMGQMGGRDHLTAVMAGSESSRFVYCGQAPLPVCCYHLHGWRGSSNRGFLLPGSYPGRCSLGAGGLVVALGFALYHHL